MSDKELQDIKETLERFRSAINELGEREHAMTKEFEDLKAASDALKAQVGGAVTVVTTLTAQVTDLGSKVDALTKQTTDLNAELNLPHEDVDGIVALTADIKATLASLTTALTPAAPAPKAA